MTTFTEINIFRINLCNAERRLIGVTNHLREIENQIEILQNEWIQWSEIKKDEETLISDLRWRVHEKGERA